MSKTKKYLQLYNHSVDYEEGLLVLDTLKKMFPDLIILDYAIDDYFQAPNAIQIEGKSSWIPCKQFVAARLAYNALLTQYMDNDELDECLLEYRDVKVSKKINLSKPHRIKYFKKETGLN